MRAIIRSAKATLLIFIGFIGALFLFVIVADGQNAEAEKIYKHVTDDSLNMSNADCIREMGRAIELDHTTAVYFYKRASCYLFGDETAKAIADLDEAIKLKPSYVSALYSRSYIYAKTDKQLAIADLKRIIEIDPRQTGAYEVLARTYLELGKYDDALQLAHKLIELSPTGSIGFRYAAESLARQGKYDEAITFYSEAIKRADWDSTARRGRAEAYRKMGNISAAEEDEKRAEVLEKSSGGIGGGMGSGSGDGTLENPALPSEANSEPSEPAAKIEPIQITRKPAVHYTEAARKDQVQGQVTLRITFKSDGTIGTISVVTGLPDGLTDQAIEAAKQIEFKPATRNGIPVTTAKIITYTFNIY